MYLYMDVFRNNMKSYSSYMLVLAFFWYILLAIFANYPPWFINISFLFNVIMIGWGVNAYNNPSYSEFYKKSQSPCNKNQKGHKYFCYLWLLITLMLMSFLKK